MIAFLMHGKICQLNISLTVVCFFFPFKSDWLHVNLESTLFACHCEIFNLLSSFSSFLHFQMDIQTNRQEDLYLLKWKYIRLFGKRVRYFIFQIPYILNFLLKIPLKFILIGLEVEINYQQLETALPPLSLAQMLMN